MSWLSRLRNVWRSGRISDEIDAELRFHLDSRVDDLIREGWSPRAARREAARRLGGTLGLRERSRDIKLLPSLDAIVQDVRFGLRLLRRHAAVTLAAIASLALAIGASTVAFALLDAIVLRPLPVAHPDELIALTYPAGEEIGRPRESGTFSTPFFERAREATRPAVALFAMSAQFPRPVTFDRGTGAAGEPIEAERVYAQHVSGDTFNILGLRPALGRLITPADDLRPGEHPLAVISYELWRRRFQRDPGVLQRHVTVDDREFQIVGVMEERFTGIEPGVMTDLWLPLTMGNRRALTAGFWNWHYILGRVRPDASREQVAQTLQLAFTNFRQDLVRGAAANAPRPPSPEQIARLIKTPLHVHDAANGPSALREKLQRPLWILALVVALVLLIACSNVANLLIARATARQREMALRISIGAGRGRLVQQVLIESALLAIAACVLGAALAFWSTPFIVQQLGASRDPVRLALGFDWRVLLFLGLVCSAATLMFGVAPALHVSAVAPQDALKSGDGRQSARRGLARLLVAAQVGFCFVVLFIAGLFLLTFQRLVTEDLGFRQGNLVLLGVGAKEVAHTAEGARAAWQQLQDRVRQVAGVEDASYSNWSLFSGAGWSGSIHVEGRPDDPMDAYFLAISPRFVSTMGMRLIAGRELEPADLRVNDSPATVVNQTFATRYFPGQDAVGKRFQTINDNKPAAREIVGVVQDARYDSVREPVPATAYFPLQSASGLTGGTLEVRTSIDPAVLIEMLRREARLAHPAFRLGEATLQSTLVSDTVNRERLLAWLSGFFAIVAILLAAIGLYGVLSYTVLQRTREIGIRIALGARRGGLVRLVVADVLWLIAIGLTGGLAGGWLLTRSLTGLLYQVQPSDAISLMIPIACLLLSTAVAALPPALRAMRVDPLIALRYE